MLCKGYSFYPYLILYEPVYREEEIANLILAMCMQMLQNGCRKNKINFPKVEIKI